MAPLLNDFADFDATAQAELVRTKQVSSCELVDAAIAAIERLNPSLNAVIIPLFDLARERAARAQSSSAPFCGVPFLLKDIGANGAGLPQYQGNQLLKARSHTTPADAPLFSRFLAAGLIPLGKTNVPEFGNAPTTEPAAFGATANPWNLERSCGGSSGGAGAAVAARLVAVAHASDGGGSLRLPAGWCGLVGLKPTRGRVPFPDRVVRNNTDLALGRTVRDAAGILDAVHGATQGDLFRARASVASFAAALSTPSTRLRVGVLTEAPDTTVHPEVTASVIDVADRLASLGHTVDYAAPPRLWDRAASRATAALWTVNHALPLRHLARVVGRPITRDDVEPYAWEAAGRAGTVTGVAYLEACEAQQLWAAEVASWWRGDPSEGSGWDILLTPTCAAPAPRLGELVPPADDPLSIGRRFAEVARFCLPFNVTGQPALSLPVGAMINGTPTGIQLVGAMEREDLLLQLGAELEEAMPWIDMIPAIAAADPTVAHAGAVSRIRIAAASE